MLIFDAYSWGYKVYNAEYTFMNDNGVWYYCGVVNVYIDAYYGANLSNEDFKTIIVVEFIYGRNGKTRSNDNDSPEGVVYCKRCLSWKYIRG